MKHINIPIFVPHYGCPFSCVFCNQNEITGRNSSTDIAEAEKIIEEHLLTTSGKSAEIAFFGGSFTAIPQNIMKDYLNLGYRYVKSGNVDGIRISTRPDFIDTEILDILKTHGVTTIELGAQSFDDEVLKKSGRGHTAQDIKDSALLIKQNGFSLGIQLMTGLYGDTEEKSVDSALQAVALNPDCVRIYPALVIKGTKLFDLYNTGKYIPQTLEETVSTVSKMLGIFYKHNINVIRVGLASTEEMNSRGTIAAGPDHPAIRELCEGRIYLDIMENYIKDNHCDKITVFAPKHEFSKISGHKKYNSEYLYKKYKSKLKLVESDSFLITSE